MAGGLDMLLSAVGFTPEKMKEMFATFENMKKGVEEFKTAMNTLNENQKAEALRAEERHQELLAAIAGETVSAAPDKDRTTLDA